MCYNVGMETAPEYKVVRVPKVAPIYEGGELWVWVHGSPYRPATKAEQAEYEVRKARPCQMAAYEEGG